MKLLTSALLFGLTLSSLAACGTDDDGGGSTTIESTPLAGKVGGADWTFVAGDTDAFLSEGDDTFFTSLYPATFTACGFSGPSGDHLIVGIPKAVGEYPMSLSRNMTFVVGDQNLIGINGKIRVDEVTDTKLKGGLVGSYDGDNQVSGTFEVTICPPEN
ncbi:MAG: hypothetical protein HOV81_22770 [Kofleriaceae bacterium]|nr:hypothetical protein [Kofleriaceae bacterium]